MARISLTIWHCGRCGKPRGLHHLCRGGKKGRDRIGLSVAVRCQKCGGRLGNPLAHVCKVQSDFRKRAAAQKRAEAAAKRKRQRRAAAARKRARAKERKRLAAEKRKELLAELAAKRKAADRKGSHDRQRHEYVTCTDPYCDRFGCRVYREGQEAGRLEGHADGYAQGFADGLSADPGGRPLKSKGGFW